MINLQLNDTQVILVIIGVIALYVYFNKNCSCNCNNSEGFGPSFGPFWKNPADLGKPCGAGGCTPPGECVGGMCVAPIQDNGFFDRAYVAPVPSDYSGPQFALFDGMVTYAK